MVDNIQLTRAAIQNLAGTPHQGSSAPLSGQANLLAGPEVRFEDILAAQLDRPPAVRLSAHAQRRLTARNIPFGSDEAARLEQAVEKAASKGSRESLILMDDLALVVNIKNRVVVTAIDAQNRKENVFTNIDSVVLT